MENKCNHSWLDLPQDLLISVLERLGFADFQRAKSVCRSWYFASRQVVAKTHIHWVIIFPGDEKTNSCTLFNPEEKDKLYKTQSLDVEFPICCRETHGSWLLIRDRWCNLYILNLFTHERINLPPADLLWKEYELRLSMPKCRYKWFLASSMRSAVFWIDEKTKDYVVVWGLMGWCVIYSKKGDTSWNQIPQTSDCFKMVYKEDHKLYFLSKTESFKIFDFSGGITQETFQCIFKLEKINHFPPLSDDQWKVNVTKLVVTVTENVLQVEQIWRHSTRTTSFRVFEVYSSDLMKKTERRINSLGEESMLLDKGITVLAVTLMDSLEIPSISVVLMQVRQWICLSSISRHRKLRNCTHTILLLFHVDPHLDLSGSYQVACIKMLISTMHVFLFKMLFYPSDDHVC